MFIVSLPSMLISIHAPVKGATSYLKCWKFYLYNFNPRPREGSDGSKLLLR